MKFRRFALTLEFAQEILRLSEAGELGDEARHQVLIGRFSKAMCTRLAIPDRDLVTSVAILAKSLHKHRITPAMMVALPNLLDTATAAYVSDTERNSIVVVTVALPDGRQPLLVPFRVDVPDAANKPNMHWMVSAYAKDNPQVFEIWKEKGLLIWEAEGLQPAKEISAGMASDDAELAVQTK